MTVVVTKASNPYWYKIKVFNTIEDIQHFMEECENELIVYKNIYTDDKFFKFWHGMKTEDIPIIKQCPLHIKIYDDYVE